MKYRLAFAGVVAALFAVLVACGSSPTGATQTGTLSVAMTDSPFSDAKALLVTITEVSAHASGGSWFSVTQSPKTCDLKKLTNVQAVLGTAQLQAGHYTEIRLTVSSATIYFDSPSTGDPCAAVAAEGAKGTQVEVSSGQIIRNRPFDLTDGATTSMVLDFQGDPSVVKTGNGAYRMTPVIEVVSVR